MKKLMVLVAAIAMISGSAYAADWNFYGSARVATFWDDVETIGSGADSETDYNQALQGNSRIGANVKVSDELTGRFEYGTGVNVRILWGEWNFGSGSLGVGQHYTPLNWFYSNQVWGGDTDLLPFGGVYSGRQGMLQLKFGGLKLAMLAPKTANSITGASTETTIPGLEASYNMKFDALSVNLGAGYQTFEANVGSLSYDVDSWVLAAGAKMDLGAFYVAGDLYFGENAGSIIAIGPSWGEGTAGGIVNGSVDDADNLGFIIVAGFNMNDMLSFEGGYGYTESELDSANDADETSSWYLNATITMAPGVFVVPEFGMVDGEEDGDGETTYFGAKWQINF